MAVFDTNIQEITDAMRRRFWPRVRPTESGCWHWIGGIRTNGYGTFAVRDLNGRWTQTTSHRFAYQDQVGPIPEGYEVDHLCRVRSCVRPEHLEAITIAENRRRRDAKAIFDIPLNARPLPTVPAKPQPPPKPDLINFCKNGHEYAVVGKVINGFGRNHTRRLTCAACRATCYAKKRKGNYASTRTHCPQGHPYSGANLRQSVKYKNGRPYNSRHCRSCERERNRKAWESQRRADLTP